LTQRILKEVILMPKKILLPSDGSEYALKATEYLKKLFKDHKDIEVTILYVGHIPTELVFNGQFFGLAEMDLNLDKMIENSAEPIFEKTKEIFSDTDFTIRTVIQSGSPAEEIALFAKSEKFDLIVIGSRGFSEIKGILLGSVSDRVAHISLCPVLIVK
jgi:nucleotide-binding universal stress UspA family protein